jgi:hypothetical protein
MRRSDIVKIIIIVSTLTLLILGGAYLFGGFEGISGHGLGALVLGVTVSLALGVGLMVLMYSSSREHDEAAHNAAREVFRDKDE